MAILPALPQLCIFVVTGYGAALRIPVHAIPTLIVFIIVVHIHTVFAIQLPVTPGRQIVFVAHFIRIGPSGGRVVRFQVAHMMMMMIVIGICPERFRVLVAVVRMGRIVLTMRSWWGEEVNNSTTTVGQASECTFCGFGVRVAPQAAESVESIKVLRAIIDVHRIWRWVGNHVSDRWGDYPLEVIYRVRVRDHAVIAVAIVIPAKSPFFGIDGVSAVTAVLAHSQPFCVGIMVLFNALAAFGGKHIIFISALVAEVALGRVMVVLIMAIVTPAAFGRVIVALVCANLAPAALGRV